MFLMKETLYLIICFFVNYTRYRNDILIIWNCVLELYSLFDNSFKMFKIEHMKIKKKHVYLKALKNDRSANLRIK